MPNAFVSFAEVKVRVTFEMLLAHYGLQDGFTRKGDALAGPCPICQSAGKRPFSVNLRKNAWYCFAKCQGGGNILDFVSRKEGVEIRRAAELLDRWFGLGLGAGPPPTEARASPETRRTAPAPPVPAANPPLTFALKQLDPAHPGFAAYGLSEATARAFEAGHCARGMLRDYLAIPVRNRVGELVAYVGLDPDPAAPERYKLPPTFHPEARGLEPLPRRSGGRRALLPRRRDRGRAATRGAGTRECPQPLLSGSLAGAGGTPPGDLSRGHPHDARLPRLRP